MNTPSRLIRTAAATLAMVLAASEFPAFSLESNPQGKKHAERHVFRDVQLGLSHPSTHGKSTQTSVPPKPLFPWLLPPSDPGAVVQGGTGAR
ncbi:hypothetical protein ABLE91_04545 [Aquabacter sp. CN5-332]|uniref:hypothetical protein n=1 Tax=Aquabacter sp. CN5-332 TaxID=3156608 RepID=UPI0032B5AFB0